MKTKPIRITVGRRATNTPTGTRVVDGVLVPTTGGVLAITPSQYKKGCWTITHTPSGFAVPCSWKTKAKAMACARIWWTQHLTEPQRSGLRDAIDATQAMRCIPRREQCWLLDVSDYIRGEDE